MSVIGTIFRSQATRAQSAGGKIGEALTHLGASKPNVAAALKAAEDAGSTTWALSRQGTVESGYVFGKFLATPVGGTIGALFRAAGGAKTAAKADAQVSAGVELLRQNQIAGATDALMGAKATLRGIS